MRSSKSAGFPSVAAGGARAEKGRASRASDLRELIEDSSSGLTIPKLSPIRLFLVELGVVFAAEAAIMLLLPWIVPSWVSARIRAFGDATLLTLLIAPILWWILISPLRRIAVFERAKATSIVRTAADGILTVASDGTIQSFNPAAERIFGYTAASVLGQSVTRLVAALSIAADRVGLTIEAEGRRLDGSLFPVLVSLSRIQLEDRFLYTAIVRDLSDLKAAEAERLAAAREKEALRTQQVMTLAQVATGVAHEMRNPLTSIKMLVQSHQEESRMSEPLRHDLRMVEEEIRRMERTLSTFLAFARPSKPRRAQVCLNDIIRRTLELLDGRIRKQAIQVHTLLPESVVMVEGDWEQLQQLLLNLTLNALDAMPDGGDLEIGLATRDAQIRLSVQDSGRGIPEASLEQIFEPFYTTKETGVGLGLGISRRIAQEHSGQLRAENAASGGARFVLVLPVS